MNKGIDDSTVSTHINPYSGRLAPIAYFATQFFFLACLVLSTRSMIEFSDSMYLIAYW